MPRPSPEENWSTVTEFYSAWYNGTPTVLNAPYPFNLRRSYRSYSGQVTPGWPKVVRVNPYSLFYSEHTARPVLKMNRHIVGSPTTRDEIDYYYRGPTFEPPYGFLGPGEASHLSGPRDTAVGKAMDDVKAMSVNFAQMLAERKQVERMWTEAAERIERGAADAASRARQRQFLQRLEQIATTRSQFERLSADRAARVARAFRALRRGDLSGVRSALGWRGGPKRLPKGPRTSRQLASDWLQFQYGWLPLLSDVHGAAEQVAKSIAGRPLTIIGKGKSYLNADLKNSERANSLGAQTFYRELQFRTSAKCELRFEVTNAVARLGGETGITDPALLAWELVPYSFVVDWFLPVGQFLERLTYDSGLDFTSGYVTEKTVRQTLVSLPSSSFVNGSYQCDQLGGIALASIGVRVDRNKFTSAPRPTLPVLENPFSYRRLANALSLLRVAFK